MGASDVTRWLGRRIGRLSMDVISFRRVAGGACRRRCGHKAVSSHSHSKTLSRYLGYPLALGSKSGFGRSRGGRGANPGGGGRSRPGFPDSASPFTTSRSHNSQHLAAQPLWSACGLTPLSDRRREGGYKKAPAERRGRNQHTVFGNLRTADQEGCFGGGGPCWHPSRMRIPSGPTRGVASLNPGLMAAMPPASGRGRLLT
jgi:hypothetical protein